MKIRLVIFMSMFCGTGLYADQFHYHNFLIGDRAIGIGGAYSAISDDSSGVYYNPAGLAYALSNDISGSANAFYKSSVVYEKAVANQNFTESNSGTVPSFFGGLQKLDNILPGLVFAFGIYEDNSELKDQNTLIQNVNLGVAPPCADGKARNPFVLERFHRTANERASTLNVAGALGYRIMPRVAIGVGLNYMDVDELVQEYQDVRELTNACSTAGESVDFTSLRTQNVRQHLLGYGLQLMLAIQVIVTERLSWALTLKPGQFFSQSLDQESEVRGIQANNLTQSAIDAAAVQNQGATTNGTVISEINNTISSNKPLGTPPLEIRSGVAYFYSPRLLLSLDLDYHGSVTNSQNIVGLGNAYEKKAILDYAMGLEYYITPSVPIRLGWFTNYDARPTLEASQIGQRDHIDYNGESIFLAWVQPNSQIGAGFVFQQGWGQAQKVSGSAAIQKVAASSLTFAFSATHSL